MASGAYCMSSRLPLTCVTPHVCFRSLAARSDRNRCPNVVLNHLCGQAREHGLWRVLHEFALAVDLRYAPRLLQIARCEIRSEPMPECRLEPSLRSGQGTWPLARTA